MPRPKPHSLCAKINPKWVIDLNVKCETTCKILRKITEDHLWDPGLGQEFLDLTPKAIPIRGKNQ